MRGCQDMKKYKIDWNKNIGNVIFVVEGGRPEQGGTELRLLKNIFSDVLGYRVQELRRGSDEFIGHGNNSGSQVFALNLEKNQLTQLTEDALDKLFARLKIEFKIKPEDCPIFFLYDRDYKSYHHNELRGGYIKKYTDPYGDDQGNQGQLLLSYPSVESYLLSCIQEEVYQKKFYLGKEVKSEIAKMNFSEEKINSEEQIVHAAIEMDKGLLSMGIADYALDSLASTLLKVYDKQQEYISEEGKFSLFSLISMALLELGIITNDIGEEGDTYDNK